MTHAEREPQQAHDLPQNGDLPAILANAGIPAALRSLPSDLMDLCWASAYTGIPIRDLRRMAGDGRFPEIWVLSRGALRVSGAAFAEWLRSKRVSPDATRAAQVKPYRLGGPDDA